MTQTSCPSCGYSFTPAASAAVSVDGAAAPDQTVLAWFRDDPWSGELSTDEAYSNYLRTTNNTPVSRRRFVADLSYLGVEQVLDDDVQMLMRR